MREFRLVYGSPCRTGRLCKTGYVCRRIHVGVPPVSARTGKEILFPFSDVPAYRARLARVGRVDVHHGYPKSLGLVSNKILQLPKGPAVEPCAYPLPRLDAVADMGQVFHADFPHAQRQSLPDDGFGNFVVDVFDMPPLPTRDSPQFPLRGAATVGLKTAAMGKVAVTFKPQFPAAEYLAITRGGKSVFSDIHTHHATFGDARDIGDIQYKIEIPLAFATDQLSFLGAAGRQQIGLVFTAYERHQFAAVQCKQRHRTIAQRVSPMVEVNRCAVEGDCWNGLAFRDALAGLERFIRASNPVDGIASHLAAQCRKSITNRVVRQMVQRHPIPAAMRLNERHKPVTGLRERVRKLRQFLCLLRGSEQFQGDRPFHIKMALQEKGGAGTGAARAAALSFPGMNAGVFRVN